MKLPPWLTTLYQHMSAAERIALHVLAGVVLLSAIVSITTYVRNHTKLIPQSGGLYTEAVVGQPHFLNPLVASANDADADISRLIFSGLFRLDENLTLQNDLAESYEVAPNQREYIIRLRSGITWHDGQPFTADDVVFTIRSIQTPDYGSPEAAAFQGVEVEKVDAQTVRFTLKQPYAPFLISLTVGIIPQHIWQTIAPRNAVLAEQMLKPVGTGPFQFKELTTRRRTGEITELKLTRFANYYGPRPYLDGITFSFFPTHDDALDALLSGNVSGVGFVPLQRLGKLEKKSRLDTHRLLLPQYFALFFNQSKNTVLRDAGVRNALNLAIDRERLVKEALLQEGEVLHLPIPPGVFAFNQELGAPKFDLEAATQNLDSAGWKDSDNDGIREKNKERLTITITTTDWPEYSRTAELVKEQWRAIGVEAQVQTLSAGLIQQAAIRPRDYEVLLFGEILSAQPDPYPFWHSSQSKSPGLNFAQFSNKETDKLLEQARQTLNDDERQKLYNDFQAKVLDLKPALILYRPYYLFATKDTVHGATLRYADRPAGRFNNIEAWHVKVRRVWK